MMPQVELIDSWELSMNSLQEIFRSYGSAYLDRYGAAVPAAHRKVIRCIQECGTQTRGTHLFVCDSCQDCERVGSSCGNRHCPVCQSGKSDEWLRKQLKKVLPTNYFMITFTVPEELRRVIRSNQKIAYAALFDAASGAIKKLAKDPRFVGCDLSGFTAILHTWTRQLEYHPHLHFIVPGGGIDQLGEQWHASGTAFFVHAKPLGKIFRAKFVEQLVAHGLEVPSSVWNVDWVVDSRHVGSGKQALKYIAQYVFRVAISPNRIVEVTPTHVSFRYKKSGTNSWRICKLTHFEFIRRYLQHVLPHGFTKVRHYGFLSPNSRISLKRIRELICRLYEIIIEKMDDVPRPIKKPWVCKNCNGHFIWFKFKPPQRYSG